MKLTSELTAIILTGLVSFITATVVARIEKKPTETNKQDKYGFFYDQYHTLLDGKAKEVDRLKINESRLEEEIKNLQIQIKELEEDISVQKKEIIIQKNKLIEEKENVAYWKEEAETAYEIIEKEL